MFFCRVFIFYIDLCATVQKVGCLNRWTQARCYVCCGCMVPASCISWCLVLVLLSLRLVFSSGAYGYIPICTTIQILGHCVKGLKAQFGICVPF